MEDALGEKATAIALTAAGRNRGKNLALNWDLTKVTSFYLTRRQETGDSDTGVNPIVKTRFA